MILWLTLAELGGGLLATTWLTRRSEVREDFLRFLGVTGAIALAPLAAAAGGAAGPVAGSAAGVAALGGLLVSWGGNRLGVALIRVAAVPAVAALALVAGATDRPGPSPPVQPWLLGLDVLTSAVLLGATTAAMILGHWYLVQTGMPIRPLLRLTAAIAVLAALKGAMLVGVFATYGWPPSRAGWVVTLLLPPGLFYLVRLGFGVVGPLAMAPLIWRTARIHATQSATGILYAVVFLVLVGEMTASFLRGHTPFPF
ncbi:MAG: hypothetical protein PVF68_04000 [Acidobacteriota bacterium]|jgi:hypothetical protein